MPQGVGRQRRRPNTPGLRHSNTAQGQTVSLRIVEAQCLFEVRSRARKARPWKSKSYPAPSGPPGEASESCWCWARSRELPPPPRALSATLPGRYETPQAHTTPGRAEESLPSAAQSARARRIGAFHFRGGLALGGDQRQRRGASAARVRAGARAGLRQGREQLQSLGQMVIASTWAERCAGALARPLPVANGLLRSPASV